MSIESTLQSVSVPTGQSFASLQYTFVQINASGQLVAPSGAGVFCDGVIQDDNPYSTTVSSMAFSGVSKVASGASINQGDLVMTDSSGRAVTATGSNHILGRALAGNGSVAGILVPVLLLKGGHASSGI